MKLLQVEGYRAVPSGESIAIKAFRNILERDKTPEKDKACLELGFIWMVCDWESPLVRQLADEETLYLEAAEEIFGKDTKWEPDDLVLIGIEKYKALNEHPIVGVLKAAYTTLANYRQYLITINFESRDSRNGLVHDAKKVMDTLNNLGKTVDSLDQIEEKVKKKQGVGTQIRGGFEPNEFSK